MLAALASVAPESDATFWSQGTRVGTPIDPQSTPRLRLRPSGNLFLSIYSDFNCHGFWFFY